jgi:hypothetical protein
MKRFCLIVITALALGALPLNPSPVGPTVARAQKKDDKEEKKKKEPPGPPIVRDKKEKEKGSPKKKPESDAE